MGMMHENTKWIMDCEAKNVATKLIHICLDSRKDECKYSCHIKQGNIEICLCTKIESQKNNGSYAR